MDMLTKDEYIEELEKLVKTYLNEDYSEFFYWDVLPELDESTKLAYSKATGHVFETYDDEEDE